MTFDEWYAQNEGALGRLNKMDAIKLAWHEGRDSEVAESTVIIKQKTAKLESINARLSRENAELKTGFESLRNRQKLQAMATGATRKSKFGMGKNETDQDSL